MGPTTVLALSDWDDSFQDIRNMAAYNAKNIMCTVAARDSSFPTSLGWGITFFSLLSDHSFPSFFLLINRYVCVSCIYPPQVVKCHYYVSLRFHLLMFHDREYTYVQYTRDE